MKERKKKWSKVKKVVAKWRKKCFKYKIKVCFFNYLMITFSVAFRAKNKNKKNINKYIFEIEIFFATKKEEEKAN